MFFEKKNEDKNDSETVKTAETENTKTDGAEGADKKSENPEVSNAPEKIQKEILVAELVQKHPELVEPLMMMGMHCISCFASQMETLEEAAMVHGLNPDEVTEELNQFLEDESNGKIPEAAQSIFY